MHHNSSTNIENAQGAYSQQCHYEMLLRNNFHTAGTILVLETHLYALIQRNNLSVIFLQLSDKKIPNVYKSKSSLTIQNIDHLTPTEKLQH
jgi:hypothetical protein